MRSLAEQGQWTRSGTGCFPYAPAARQFLREAEGGEPRLLEAEVLQSPTRSGSASARSYRAALRPWCPTEPPPKIADSLGHRRKGFVARPSPQNGG